MYGNGQGIGMYKRTRVVTSDPGKLVLLCYEGAISHLKMAREHFQAKEFELKAKAVQKTIDILHELLQSLDFQRGGEVARNLSALYTYMSRRIVEGDLGKNLKAFDEVIGMLEELEGTWKKVCNGARNSAALSPHHTPAAPEELGKSKETVSVWRA